MKWNKTAAPASRTIQGLVLALSLWLVAVPARAGNDAHWIPHTLSTTPPVDRPLGCRQNESQETCTPNVDLSRLPPVGKDHQNDLNPYHGNAAIAAIGHDIFNQACAYCHGKDAVNEGAIGPDLTRLHSGCKSVTDKTLHQRCERDVNAFFVHRVLNGKATLGIVMMPPWGGVLSNEEIWALKTYLESHSRK